MQYIFAILESVRCAHICLAVFFGLLPCLTLTQDTYFPNKGWCFSSCQFCFMSGPRGGCPKAVALYTEGSSTSTHHCDIGLYPSTDGTRVIRDAPSPKKRRRRVEPQQLDDNYATWMPGICEEHGEGQDSEEEATGADVIANIEVVGLCKRYMSSVSCSPFPLSAT